MHKWTEFPYDSTAFDYPGKTLKEHWSALHCGDQVDFPEDERLQDAWRCYHRGDFQQAVALADAVGIAGHAVANKATGVYATYLEENERIQLECFKSAAARAEKAIDAYPDDPNSHYFHAFNLGRYGQSISIIKALKQGIGGKISDSLHATLELQPRHAEAHSAMGAYHAEIIASVGKLIGGMTYGAKENKAIEHYQTALELTPDSPIAHIEYGNGLYLLYGDSRLDEVTDLYVRAAELSPGDAMEKLDVESAAAELEE
jgi:tetratricopeptide (TPR) repeat protein